MDASVAVAAFSSWHPRHREAARALDREAGIVAHAAYETYSVLTRLPGPHRMPAGVVRTWLEREFADRWLTVGAGEQRALLARLEQAGIRGGATYDGLIAGVVATHGATLVTCDERAVPVYERVGTAIELLA